MGVSPEALSKFNNDRVVGMLGMYQAPHDVKTKTAILMGLYVGREFRNRSVASRLIEAMLAMLYEHGKVKYARLGVNAEQTTAVKLYEKFGFNLVDKQKITFGDGKVHEEYIMEKTIR
jgi:ribosomal protein S18 acetylase RimI-like enzyme